MDSRIQECNVTFLHVTYVTLSGKVSVLYCFVNLSGKEVGLAFTIGDFLLTFAQYYFENDLKVHNGQTDP